MKRLYSFLAGILAIILVLWGISYHLDSKINSRDSQKLVIYNWGDYIDPELLEKFPYEPESRSRLRGLKNHFPLQRRSQQSHLGNR